MNSGEAGVVAVAIPLVGGVSHGHIVVCGLGDVSHDPCHSLVGLILLLSEGRVGGLGRISEAGRERGGQDPAALANLRLVLAAALIVAREGIVPGADGSLV